ncbi:FxSxx-COOH system tetratricopeptide repeat protein [Actinoplanes subtropicus]|uniref:FxSxx-COOH system tetratricopeptide repeat protein n=1 Tax=Actinoplanes subtropicus TaxID=543632 RepID=UPI0007C546B1|nr:FxSxx-COOH system tetratricopeptide repeat protein [Actinoplanes subtropicus]
MQTVIPTTASSVRLPRVWGGVPPRNPNFTGRDLILERLHKELLEARETAVLPQALHGMGGVGKSQVAIEYVHRHSSDYDLVWWIPAEQDSQVLASLTRLAQRLHLEVSPEADSAVPAVQDALNTGEIEYKRWLLVFDNAESMQDVRPYFPTGGAGKILVTSRNPEWSAVARSLEVDVFTREESRKFLRSRTPELSDKDAGRLAEALGDLPLAVEQAAAWHTTTGMPVGEYLELLSEKSLELLNENAPPDYPRSVAAAWNVSLDRLEKTDNAALQLLQVCSFFSPEPISRELFGEALPSGIVEPLDETLKDPIKLARAIRAISRSALAKFNHESNSLQIHRLIQAVLVRRMDEDQRDLMRSGAQALLAAANPHSPGRRSTWDRYQALLPHVRMSDAIASNNPSVLRLVLEMVEFLYHWGDHRGCLELAEEAHRNWLSKLGEDDPHTLRLAKFLGYIKALMGQYAQAGQLFERSLELYRETVGDDDEGTLDAKLLVAYSLRLRGDFAEARKLDEETFLTCRRIFGEDDPVTLRAAHNLGLSLRLVGEFGQAERRDRDTYERRRAILGADDSESLRTLRNWLVDRRESGDFVNAARELEAALKRTLAATDQRNPQVMQATRDLAVARRKAGDHQRALECSADALERFRRRYGDDFPDTMAAALSHAVDLRQTGKLEDARRLGEQTLQRYRASLGELHPHTLSAQVNLAIVDRRLGFPQKAYRADKESLESLTARLGKNHPTSLACATNLASDLFAMGDVDAAHELDTDTLARSEKVLGVEHPSTLAIGVNLALDLRALGREQEADLLHTDTMARFRRSLGDQHPATLNALRSLRADCDLDPMPL